MNKPELLAPAGNLEKMKTAIHYGVDAGYLGMSSLSLRARADNFNEMELEEAFYYAQEGKQISQHGRMRPSMPME